MGHSLLGAISHGPDKRSLLKHFMLWLSLQQKIRWLFMMHLFRRIDRDDLFDRLQINTRPP